MAEELDLKAAAQAIEDSNRAFEEFKKKNDERLKEVKKGFDDVVRTEELKRIDDAISEAQAVNDKLVARLARIEAVGDTDSKSREEREEKLFKWYAGVQGLHGRRIRREDFGEDELKAAQNYAKAFESFVRKGGEERLLTEAEMKALSVGTDPDGGYVVHPDMSGRMVERIFETSPMRQYAAIQTIGTDALEGLYDVDEAGFGWVGETEARSETSTPQIEKWRIPVHEMYAKPKTTQKLLDDASVNVEDWLTGKIMDRFSRAENAAFVNGTGVNQPRGFLTYDDYASAGVFEIGAIEQFDTGVNGAYAAAPAGGDVLIQALYGLKAQYRANATWFMNRATQSLTRRVKDSDGAYLWVPGIQAGQPASLLAHPVASFEDMPDPGTGTLSVAVGDMREAYQIVERHGMRLLRDPYSAKPYVEFYAIKRVGGDVLNFEALKLVNFKA